MEGELLEWEMLHGSDTDSLDSQPADENSRNFSEIAGVSMGTIRSDHFSINNLSGRPGKTPDARENYFVESDESGGVSPGLESPNRRNDPNEVLADSTSDQSADGQLSDACVSNELGFIDGATGEMGSGSGEEMESKTELLGESETDECKPSDFGIADAKNVESRAVAEEIGETPARDEDSNKFWSDSGGEGLVSPDSGDVDDENVEKREESGISSESDHGIISTEEIEGRRGNMIEQEEPAINLAAKAGDEGQKRSIVWWKMPFVLLKYYAFKIGPVWSVSVAAAVMGLALLGRRLYNMKKKTQRFQLKVTIDDKKVSRVMSQAARLNEAFTEVRRVPVIRPALPAPGANLWPVLSLR